MRTQMVIGMASSSRKGHSKAMKIAAETHGVESVTLAGKDRSLLVVVGDGVDSNALTTKLRRKVGRADLVELHTLHASIGKGGGYYYAPPPRAADYVSSSINGGYGTYPAAATTPGSYVSSSRAAAAAAEYGGSSKSVINGGYGTAAYPATAAAVSYDAPVPAEYDDEYEYSHKLPSSSYGGYYNAPLPAPATTYATAPTVVHHEYYPAAGDQNGCCIM